MSKGVKTVIGIAAAVAVPFVAPAIASTIGLSAAIGSTAGSALVGAGLGAVSSAVTGGDVGRGALMGAIGGGIGGYNYTPASAVTPAMQQTISGAPQGAFLGEGVASGVPAWDAAATAAGVPLTTPATVGLAIPAYTPTVSTPGVTGMQGAFLGEGVASGVPSWDAAATQAGVPLMTPTTVGPALPPSAPEPFSQAVSQVAPVAPTAPTPTAAAPGARVVVPPGINPATGQPYTFTEALAQVPANLAAKFSDPNALADLVLRAGGVIAGSAFAGEGLSDEEKQLLNAQVEELRRLQQENQALFNQRLQQAQALTGESKYFDPEYFGLQRARRAQIAGARAKRAGLRGLTGAGREAAARQFDLATGRDVGTAFDQGFSTGVQGRLQTMQTGLQLMPQEYPSLMGAYGNIRSAYESAARRRDETAGRIGDLFGSITGSSQARRP